MRKDAPSFLATHQAGIHPRMPPEQYPHRVLVVVSGMSPQVLTETLYALAVQRTPPFLPTEIHLLSTSSGARHARLSLLDGDAHFHRLCDDYALDAGVFGAAGIHALAGLDGRPLDDIRSAEDNEAAADFITGFIRDQTARADAAVHVSMAGGRKTMGYYAGYALSLYGRDQDRLSHVLVSEGFEGHRDFFYPTPSSTAIYREGKPALDASEARVELAEIPFVRLRDELPEDMLASSALYGGRHGFRQAIANANQARQPQVMDLDMDALQFRCGDRDLAALGAANIALLCWLAWRQSRGVPRLDIRDILHHGKALGAEFQQVCQQLQDRDESRTAAARSHGQAAVLALPELTKVIGALEQGGLRGRGDFDYRRSNLNTALIRLLGRRVAGQFEIKNFGARGHASYGFEDFERRFRVTPEAAP